MRPNKGFGQIARQHGLTVNCLLLGLIEVTAPETARGQGLTASPETSDVSGGSRDVLSSGALWRFARSNSPPDDNLTTNIRWGSGVVSGWPDERGVQAPLGLGGNRERPTGDGRESGHQTRTDAAS